MNDSFNQFIEEQTCASICCIDELGKPYCFSCFYAYNRNERLLYFKSSGKSRHSFLMNKNPFIAGTILPDKLHRFAVRGLQFEGIVLNPQSPLIKDAIGKYLKKHPLSMAIHGEVWIIQVNSIKMNDSTAGFGKKIIWERELKKKDILNSDQINMN